MNHNDVQRGRELAESGKYNPKLTDRFGVTGAEGIIDTPRNGAAFTGIEDIPLPPEPSDEPPDKD
ncbi:MAG TPA: hypothetical protein VNY55_03105 [Mycobacterium sp.]|jgi:hypothetical protein|nr:hypothetical protein [Mycobacterium sp.]